MPLTGDLLKGESTLHPISPTLQQLWALAEKEATRKNITPKSVFDPLGLFLLDYPINDSFRYDCTPFNATPFGVTGGDGVHFSLLNIENSISDDAPVVMTVPMAFGHEGRYRNLIVGANLLEFLSLGCRIPFYAIEQIVYKKLLDADHNQRNLLRFEDLPPTDDFAELVDVIKQAFPIIPWLDLDKRISELDTLFYPQLKFESPLD